VTRRQIATSAAILALAFVVVLTVPAEDRALALFAFLLLAGAFVLSGLVLALAMGPLAQEEPLAGAPASADSPPAELSALASAIRAANSGRALDERVYLAIRAVAGVRLARNHGIELASDPAGARELIGDGVLWQLLESERSRTRVGVGAGELTQIIDRLERL
jgi:hypothetical protein